MPPYRKFFSITLSGEGLWRLNFLTLCYYLLWNFSKTFNRFLTTEGEGDNFLGLILERSQILRTQFLRKKLEDVNILEISFVAKCYLM